MSRSTTWLLLLAVALLGGLAVWQAGREQRPDVLRLPEPLFPGVDPGRVSEVRLENLERDLFVVFRREEGRWMIVEPILHPARAAYLTFLLQIAEHNDLQPLASEGEPDLGALGLDPPRAVLTYVEETGDGERRHVLEVGAVDPDPQRITVRVRGGLWTTVRNVEATIDHQLHEFRARRVMDLVPRNVVELHRSGSYLDQDATLDALLDTGEWRMTRPLEARLDPVVVGHLVVTACLLEAATFVDDLRALSELGLDPPELELTLVTVGDEHRLLQLGRDAEGAWYGCLAGSPFAYGLFADQVDVLAIGARELVDRTVVRATRDDLRAVVLRRGGRDLRVERQGRRDVWSVSEGGLSYPVDPAAFRDLLGAIEDLELGGRVDDPAAGVEDAFEGGAELGSEGFLLELEGGADQGGTFGATWTLSTGDEVRLFRRRGESLVGWVDPRAARLLELGAEDLRSLNLLDGLVEEHGTAAIAVGAGGAELVYERDLRGRWRRVGSSLEAHELVPVLDKLFFLRGAENVSHRERARLTETVVVRFVDRSESSLAVTFGRAPDADGRVEVELPNRRALPADADLYAELRAIAAGG